MVRIPRGKDRENLPGQLGERSWEITELLGQDSTHYERDGGADKSPSGRSVRPLSQRPSYDNRPACSPEGAAPMWSGGMMQAPDFSKKVGVIAPTHTTDRC